MPDILLLPDCGPGVGLGHLERLLALADRLGPTCALVLPGWREGILRAERRGHEVVIDDAPLPLRARHASHSARCLVVDAYGLPLAAQRSVRQSCSLVLVDDLGSQCSCDVAVNPSPGGETLAPDGADLFLGGARYALLNADYLDARHARETTPPRERSVIISTGATDADGLGTALAVRLACNAELEVTLVLGPDASHAAVPPRVRIAAGLPSLAGLLATHAVFCGAAGTSAVQAAAVGVPGVVTAAFDNQRAQARALAAAGCALDVRRDQIADAVVELLDDGARREAMSAAARQLVDGRGAERVARAVMQLTTAGARP